MPIIASLAACAPTAQPPPANSAEISTHEILSFNDIVIPLVSLKSAKAIDAHVSYSTEVHATDPPDRRTAFDSIERFRTPQATWFMFYLAHAAVADANGGTVPANVTIIIDPATDLAADAPWWIDGMVGMDYGRTTLALRQGVETIQFVPTDATPETDWIPLTSESYEHWWAAVDSRLGLTLNQA